MNIFDHAMRMERDGEHFYQKLGERCQNENLKKILYKLEAGKVKHYRIFDNMKMNTDVEIYDSEVLQDAKNIFAEMKKKKNWLDCNVSEVTLYEKAKELEKKSEDFYCQKAQETEDPIHKELFLKIANEGKKHYFLLDNIIKFISTPQIYLDNSEFDHLDNA